MFGNNKPAQILIADDDELVRAGLAMILDAQAELLARLPARNADAWRHAYCHYRGDPPVYVDWHPNAHAHALVAGVPAKRIGWMSPAGERLGDHELQECAQPPRPGECLCFQYPRERGVDVGFLRRGSV